MSKTKSRSKPRESDDAKGMSIDYNHAAQYGHASNAAK
jgi:hypothetical protein